MTMGEFIKKLRKGENVYRKKWSQEELGAILNPPVNRAAINKWETGKVENIKRIHIQQLAKIFGVKPSELMCFQDKKSYEASEKKSIFELIEKHYGKSTLDMLNMYNKLDTEDKAEIRGEVKQMLKSEKYSIEKELSNEKAI